MYEETTETFLPQSWLSARTGLDKHPSLRLQVDTVAHAVAVDKGAVVAQSILDLIGRLLAHIPGLHPVDHTLVLDVAAAGLGKVLDAQGVSVDTPATPAIIGDIAAAVASHAPKLSGLVGVISTIAEAEAAAPAAPIIETKIVAENS